MSVSQAHFRFGRNVLAEDTHPWFGDEDANVSLFRGQSFLIRFCTQATGVGLDNVDCELQCRRNGGAWQNVTTTSGIVRAISTNVFSDRQNCTQRLSGTGTFDTTNQGCSHDGDAGGPQYDIPDNGNVECEFACRVVVLVNQPGDTIDFRLLRDGGQSFDAYDVTPTITVQEVPSFDCGGNADVVSNIEGTVTDETRTCTAINVTNNRPYAIWVEVEQESNKQPVSMTIQPGNTEQLSLSSLTATWKTDCPAPRWDGLNIRWKEPA